MIDRRTLLAGIGAAGATAATAAASKRAASVSGAESSKLFLPPNRIVPATDERLSLNWSKQRLRILQQKLAARGYDGILLTDRWNIVYFTGLFFTSTERLMNAFIPTAGDHPVWFYPGNERELVQSWWYEDGEMYFDWPNVAGAAPQEGKVIRGPTQDLWRWALDGIKRRGFAGKKLAIDRELVPSGQKAVVEILGGPMDSVADDCMYMRMRKTPEELALTRRAYGYMDRMHAFARDLVLTHGTDLTDFELMSAADQYIVDLIMSDLKPDGRLHGAVGIVVDSMCRAGRSTSYGHPNQFLYSRIERGKPLQFSTLLQIGGCGGELYRMFMIAPRTTHMEALWTSNRDACLLQKDLCRKGTECSEVAYAVHMSQVKKGMQKYIHSRPAHGQGMEQHQPPYLALGDHTVLDTGMCLSVEPGLYDSENGIGVNCSDMLVIEPEGPSLQMSRLPWSEEWSRIKL